MKKLLLGLLALIVINTSNAQDTTTNKKLVFNPKITTYEVEATCGTCMYKMEGFILSYALTLIV
jgi:hypothetical protein